MMNKVRNINRISIIIPFYNEEIPLPLLIKKFSQQKLLPGWRKEYIFVDDGSTDKSARNVMKAIEDYNIREAILVSQTKNRGKGAAIRTGIKHSSGQYILIQDADLEYDPLDWNVLLAAASSGNTSVVYGSRNIQPNKHGYFFYYIGGIMLSTCTNILYGSHLTDVCCGTKLIKKEMVLLTPLVYDGFEFDVELTVKLLKRGICIIEVPVHYHPRSFREGKKISFNVGLKDLFLLIQERFRH